MRLVFLASTLGKIEIAEPTHEPETYRTVFDAIGDLEPLKAGEVSSFDPVHRASRLSDLNLRRVRVTPAGGGWGDWPEDLVLECHKRPTGKSYPSIYGRMWWDKPSPTITTNCNGLGNGRFGHPEQDRAISLREAALLQTFPPDYEFVEPGGELLIRQVAAQIGNSVPVLLGRSIAATIKQHLGENL